MEVNKSIFRENDIRGIYPEQLNVKKKILDLYQSDEMVGFQGNLCFLLFAIAS